MHSKRDSKLSWRLTFGGATIKTAPSASILADGTLVGRRAPHATIDTKIVYRPIHSILPSSSLSCVALPPSSCNPRMTCSTCCSNGFVVNTGKSRIAERPNDELAQMFVARVCCGYRLTRPRSASAGIARSARKFVMAALLLQ